MWFKQHEKGTVPSVSHRFTLIPLVGFDMHEFAGPRVELRHTYRLVLRDWRAYLRTAR